MLDVVQDGETVVGGADGTAGFNLWLQNKKVIQILHLWSSLGGLVSAGQLGVQGEDGQEEGGDQVGQVPHEEDYTCCSSGSFFFFFRFKDKEQ